MMQCNNYYTVYTYSFFDSFCEVAWSKHMLEMTKLGYYNANSPFPSQAIEAFICRTVDGNVSLNYACSYHSQLYIVDDITQVLLEFIHSILKAVEFAFGFVPWIFVSGCINPYFFLNYCPFEFWYTFCSRFIFTGTCHNWSYWFEYLCFLCLYIKMYIIL